MSALYFKTAPEIYAQIQPAIDSAFRVDWIEAGKCDHILPPVAEMSVREDGFCYLAVPEWMIDVTGADAFRNWPGVEEITEADYLAATQENEL